VAKVLHRDYETKSCADLRKVGAHVYARHPSTDIILACFAFDDEEYPLIWLPGDPFPADVRQHIEAGGIVAGHNATFEAEIDEGIMGPRYGWPIPKLEQLDCTMARSAVQAIPLDLDRACQAMGVREKKDKEGHKLMLRMCRPRKIHDDGRVEWWDSDPAKVARLAEYCQQDIRAERALDHALRPLTESEREIWLFTERMNRRGVTIDMEFVRRAKTLAEKTVAKLDAEMFQVTGGAVEKATQLDRIKEFVKGHGVELKLVTKTRRNGEEYEAEAADKEAIEDLLDGELPAPVRRVFEIRLDAGKASVKKLDKFAAWAAADGKARHNLQYHAAAPGRWAGRGIQLQNLPRAGITGKGEKAAGGWEQAKRDMAEIDLGMFELLWGNPLDVISRMLRGAVVASPGHKLIYADYSQIEARGSVWVAGQHDQVQLFASGGKIYETMGALIFGLTVDEVAELHATKKDIIPRFVGKETVLGCGYGMGWAAFRRNAKKKGGVILSEEIARRGIDGWRESCPRVVEYWRELEDAARHAIEQPGTVHWAKPFAFRVIGKWLQMRLPSGRVLWYRRPTIEPDAKDLEGLDAGETVPRYRWKIHFWGVNGYTKQWQKESTWGGKILENGVQGMCRDLLANAQLNHERAGFTPVLSVHDEAISEIPIGFRGLSDEQIVIEFMSIMNDIPGWANGLPVKSEGGIGVRYAK
jgi:DNA polymerase bacteriophage-type